jgi:hypothetical protein
MFECEWAVDPEEWEPIPAGELSSLGDWDFPLAAGESPSVPAGLDELVHQAQLEPLGANTLALIAATPPQLLSDEARSLGLQTLTMLAGHIEAVRAEFTVAIAGPKPKGLSERLEDYSAHEIAMATKTSVYAADHQIWFARDLADRLGATAEAMRRGEVNLAQARALSEATTHLDVAIARAVESKLLRFAFRQNVTAFRAALRRWVAKLDPDFAPRAEAARKECVVEHTAQDDGTGDLYIRGPLEITTAISMALTAYAARTKETLGGTVGQRKLAGLRDWAEAYLASPDSPTHHGRTPTVNVTVDLLTLLGLRNHPAEIPGVGAIPADAVRWLLADGAPFRRLIIDPINGQLLDYGHTQRVPADLADLLIAKNVTSAAPHSNVDARICDIEHNQPHDRGGPTNPVNCTPVDRRWRRAKTHANWRYQKADDGTVTWTSPTGLSCQIDPYDYRSDPAVIPSV